MNRWPTKPLGEVCIVANERATDGETPYLEIGNLDARTKEYVFSEKPAIKGALVTQANDLIVSRVRPTRGAITLLHEKRVAVSSAFTVLRHCPDIRPRFLLFALAWNNDFLTYLGRHSKGALYPTVPEKDLLAYAIPVPPLAEQERIVKLLDEADELRKLRTQADRRTAALLPALFHEMFGDPDTNPKKLPIVTLGNLLSFRTGKLDSNAAVENGAYPFFTCSREDARIDTYAFDCEALLLAGNNAVGDYSVKHYKGRFNAYQRTYVLNLLNPDHSYGFMQQALQLRLQELKRLSLGTGTKYLTLGILKNIEIPLPDSAQQQEFAQRVTEIRALEAGQAASRRRVDQLFQSLLHRAFNGGL